MSLREQAWWPELIEALVDLPLVDVAAAYKVDPSRVVEALNQSTQGGPVQDEPWWPEAVRIARLQGVRRAARTFDSNPRRIRRGLARAGVRVAGEAERLRWLAGVYYFDNEVDGAYDLNTDTIGFVRMDADYIQQTDSWDVFGQVEFDLAEAWTIIAGLRWTDE
ncbi:TonB-dependent receptor, partial [Myxococcota bacterium]|nr:TonB-dependent receptor [Myxococcota bacterium]